MQEIIKEFEEYCAILAISGDSPSAETIKQYFDKYVKVFQLQQSDTMRSGYLGVREDDKTDFDSKPIGGFKDW